MSFCTAGLCWGGVDEKPQIQALTGTAPVLPMRPGQPERRTHDYRRQGTTDLFAALDIQAGTVIGRCTRRHHSVEFRTFLGQIEAAVPDYLDVHLARQRGHPQNQADPRLAREASALAPSLHADIRVVAQSRRGLVCPPDPSTPAARCLPTDHRSRRCDPRLHRSDQHRPEALHLDKTCRCHPRQRRTFLPENF